jgi:hypothetical protein
MSESDEAVRDLLRLLLAAVSTGAGGRLATADPRPALVVARHHRLSPILATSITFDDELLADACRKDWVATAARNLVLVRCAERCIEALERANVSVIVLKGLAYDPLYPPGSRPSADVDLLVPRAARRVAFEVMDGLGFKRRACAPGVDDEDYHKVAWRQYGIEVDLHLALAPFVQYGIDYREVWEARVETTVGSTAAARLDPAHAAVFHALHMATNHFDVPGLYLNDFVRLAPNHGDLLRAESIARRWRCWRPFAMATALVGAFVPGWTAQPAPTLIPRFTRGIVSGYGRTTTLPRAEQLARRFT